MKNIVLAAKGCGRSKIEMFYNIIGYDLETETVKVKGIEIFLDCDDSSSKSYFDEEVFENDGDYVIHLTGLNRSVRELLFDFYHQVGHIFIKKGYLDTMAASIWLKDSGYGVSNMTIILSEMACDAYAMKELAYVGTAYRLIPALTDNEIRSKYPTLSDDEIMILTKQENLDISVRRRYLNYLIAKYSDRDDDEDISGIPLRDRMFNEKEKNKRRRKQSPKMSLRDARDTLLEYAIAYDIDVTEIKTSTSLIAEVMEDMNILHDNKISFENACNTIIQAITSPSIHSNLFIHKKGNPQPSDMRRIYKDVVKEFLIPQYKQYKETINANKRNEIKYIIEHGLKRSTITKTTPTQTEINNYKNEFNGTDDTSLNIHKASIGMLSYNDKVRIAKQKHKQLSGETDDMYNKRIHNIIIASY